MTKKNEYVKCPRCGGQANVVWISQDGKTVAIKCMDYHSHGGEGPSAKISSYYKIKPKKKFGKGMVFLIETTK